VAELVRIAVNKGRAVKPKLKIGICGEHGGDPYTIHFCNSAGLDYVSCSPFRLPIARLAAAQASLSEARKVKKAKQKSGRGKRADKKNKLKSGKRSRN
ncbi:MAG TPA: putative PEP-binding protein, partial [Chitinophagaceae bacterium]|nr:putative PEP-binding protein [Chitinophagaceae bacterium]